MSDIDPRIIQGALEGKEELTLDAVADQTGLPYKVVRDAARQGDLTAWKRGGRFITFQEFVDEWAASYRPHEAVPEERSEREMTLKEAAQAYQIPIRAIRWAIQQGLIASRMQNQRRYVTSESMHEWAASHQTQHHRHIRKKHGYTNQEIVTTNEAADITGVSAPTSRSAIHNNDLPGLWLEDHLFINRSDLEAWINARTPKSNELPMEEVSDLTGYSYQSILQGIRNDNLPARKIGGKWYIRRSDAEAWAEDRKSRPYAKKRTQPVRPDPYTENTDQ